MGNNSCIGNRKKENKIFKESIERQLDQLKEIPYGQEQRFIKYDDRSIIELLQQIEVREPTHTQTEEITQTDTDDFKQYADLGVEIIALIQSKISGFSTSSSDWILLTDDMKNPHYLKLYIKQIQLTDGNKINATFSQFVVPCKPEKFIQFMGDFKDQIKLDPRIDQFKCIKKNPDKQEQLIYLSYKSVSLVSARDFVYFKKTENIEQQKNIWCDASRSIVDNSILPIQNKIVRGDIYLSGYIIQPLQNLMDEEYYQQRFLSIAFKAESFSLVQLWSECDFKLSVPLYLAKGQIKSEMANYINLVYRSLL